MGVWRRWACLAILATLAAPDATAQYYGPRYAEPPPYVDPYRPPPGYYQPALGTRCDSRLPTGYGPRRLICDIVRPRPLGRPCVCPPPPPPPGYPPGPYLNGRVVP